MAPADVPDAAARGARRAAAVVVALAVALAACGGDDVDDDDAAAVDAPPVPGTDSTGTGDVDTGDADTAPTGSDCPSTSATMTNEASGVDFDVVSTAAVSLEDGAAYTIYGADYELDPDTIGAFSAPEVPADGNLVTVAVTVFEAEGIPPPLEVGATMEPGAEFGETTFVVSHTAGETFHGGNMGQTGSLTMLGVGDVVCVEVDYQDDEKTLAGVITADARQL